MIVNPTRAIPKIKSC